MSRKNKKKNTHPPYHAPARSLITEKKLKIFARLFISFALLLIIATIASLYEPSPASVTPFKIVNTFPHDPDAFTQGLLFEDGVLYESTGLNGKSSLRKVTLETGEPIQTHEVDSLFFAEGLASWKDHLIQLTYTEGIAFVYDKASFKEVGTHTYKGEGWGLTSNGEHLIMSDGTATLRFLDPETFAVVRTVEVTDAGRQIDQLNELEFVKGEIFANVWHSDRIARIAPASGKVQGWLDLSPLRRTLTYPNSDNVLNGIAWDAKNKRLFVTGKLWPKLYEIKIVD